MKPLRIIATALLVALSSPLGAQTYFGTPAGTFIQGVDPSGVNDSAAAINAAIQACPLAGCDLYLACGTYKVTSPIVIGNGSASTVSTRSGVRLKGAGLGVFSGAGYSTVPCTVLSWAGSAGQDMITIQGPLEGWAVENIGLLGNLSAGKCLDVVSGRYGDVNNISFWNCNTAAIYVTTVTGRPAGVNEVDSVHNHFRNTNIQVANTANAQGIALTGFGGGNDNSAYNFFENSIIYMPATGALATTAIYLGFADSTFFQNMHVVGGQATATIVNFDYTVKTNWPTSNYFIGSDLSGSLVPPTRFANTGSPAATAFPNYAIGFERLNGATDPQIAGFIVLDSFTKTWVPQFGGTSVVGTPTYTTQFGTLTQIGNYVRLRFNVAISAIGGMTGNLFIGGIPIVNASDSNDLGTCTLSQYTGWTADAGYTSLSAVMSPGTSAIALVENGSTKTSQVTPVSDYAATTQVVGECSYRTTSAQAG